MCISSYTRALTRIAAWQESPMNKLWNQRRPSVSGPARMLFLLYIQLVVSGSYIAKADSTLALGVVEGGGTTLCQQQNSGTGPVTANCSVSLAATVSAASAASASFGDLGVSDQSVLVCRDCPI